MNRTRKTGNLTRMATSYYKNTKTGYSISATDVVPSSVKTFCDEQGSDLHFKNCLNWQLTMLKEEPGVFIDGMHRNWPQYTLLCGTPWVEFLMEKIIGETIAPSQEEVDGFNMRAMDAMQPGIELAMDLPTFLTEISDIPKLLDSQILKKLGIQRLDAKEVTSKLKKTNGFITRFVLDDKVRKETLTKAVAGDFLAYSFGIAPTIADAKALYQGFKDVDKRLSELLARAGKPCLAHYSERPDRPSLDVDMILNVYNDKLTLKYEGGPSKLTATLAYTYYLGKVRDMSKNMQRMLAYMQMLGFDNPLRTIWERVPFSFVLDWIIPVGDWLEQCNIDFFDSTVEAKEYCISCKTLVPHVVETHFTRGSTHSSCKCNKFTVEYYSRLRAVPNNDTFGLRVDSRYGTKQVLLSAALLTSIFGR